MNTQDKIKAIYEKIADKALNIGTKIIWLNNEKTKDIILEQKSTTLFRTDLGYLDILENVGNYIVDNPVMIGDVLDYIEKNKDELFFQGDMDAQNFVSYYGESIRIFINIWQEKRKPLEMQNNDCINYIFDLIS